METDPEGYPIARGHIVRTSDCYLWRGRCPLCGKRHVHGLGPLAGDPKDYLGHRVSHCLQPHPHDRGYILALDETRLSHCVGGKPNPGYDIIPPEEVAWQA